MDLTCSMHPSQTAPPALLWPQGKGAGGPSRLDSLRALAVLERLASTCEATHPAMARQLTDALLPILAAPAGGGARRAAAGEAAKLRVLGTLRAVWCQLASSPDAGPGCNDWEDGCSCRFSGTQGIYLLWRRCR